MPACPAPKDGRAEAREAHALRGQMPCLCMCLGQLRVSQVVLVVKNLPANAGDLRDTSFDFYCSLFIFLRILGPLVPGEPEFLSEFTMAAWYMHTQARRLLWLTAVISLVQQVPGWSSP